MKRFSLFFVLLFALFYCSLWFLESKEYGVFVRPELRVFKGNHVVKSFSKLLAHLRNDASTALSEDLAELSLSNKIRPKESINFYHNDHIINPIIETRYIETREEIVRRFDDFFSLLQKQEMSSNTRKVEVLFVGDSVIAGDYISRFLRERWQKRFGEGGPGYQSLKPLSPSDMHKNLKMQSEHWEVYSFLEEKKQSDFGLKGAVFSSPKGRAKTTYTLKAGQVEQLEVYYQGGKPDLQLRLPGGAHYEKRWTNDYFVFDFALPVSQLTLMAGNGAALQGVSLENRKGLVLHTLSLVGSSVYHYDRFTSNTYSEALERLKPDMVMLMLGLNTAANGNVNPEKYYERFHRLVTWLEGEQKRPVWIISPMAMARADEQGRYQVPEAVRLVQKEQQRSALALSQSYIDLVETLGGKEQLAYWYQPKNRLIGEDRIHLSLSGAEKIADHLFFSLMEQYEHYLKLEREP